MSVMIEQAAPSFPLAIVIPAYKRRFLREALVSIAAQTDQRFHLYICDDGSPEELRAVCEGVLPPERMTYGRFEPNMGASHLVGHWNRSVRQTRGEPWVWLFSDDDIADPGCVAAFYRALQADEERGETAPVYRFNNVIIDEQGVCIAISPPHPGRETGLQFAYHRMRWERSSFAPDHIFARAAFDRCGGFVDFPFAIGSDDASWIAFSSDGVLRTIEGPYVCWRRSLINTSLLAGQTAAPKLLGLSEVMLWLQDRFAGQSLPPGNLSSRIEMHRLIRDWYFTFFHNVQKLFSWREIQDLAIALHGKGGVTKQQVQGKLLRSNLRFVIRAAGDRLKSWFR